MRLSFWEVQRVNDDAVTRLDIACGKSLSHLFPFVRELEISE